MHLLTTKTFMSSLPRWRVLTLLLQSPAQKLISSPFPLSRRGDRVRYFKAHRLLKASNSTIKKSKELKPKILLEDKDVSHIMWWKERMEMLRKPSSVQLVKRLTYSNLLGVDVSLRNGSLKEGTLNWEILQFKSRFPREVLLCRVGDFYEAIGIDACVLVEHAGLNPFGGLRTDSIPRAGCPVVKWVIS